MSGRSPTGLNLLLSLFARACGAAKVPLALREGCLLPLVLDGAKPVPAGGITCDASSLSIPAPLPLALERKGEDSNGIQTPAPYTGRVRILVIEDDEVIAERLQHALTKEGYAVDTVPDGERGLALAQIRPYSLILLDLMLPGRDGVSVCEALRRGRHNVPILMLTARGQVEDKVKGLDAGADDYLPKPFEFKELLARIRALLRRDKTQKGATIVVDDLEIDPTAKIVRRAGKDLHLTPREFTLLEALARNQGRVLTRDVIIEEIWADDRSLSNTVNFHVTSLRKKIDEGREQSLIETVHGFGYRLRGSD